MLATCSKRLTERPRQAMQDPGSGNPVKLSRSAPRRIKDGVPTLPAASKPGKQSAECRRHSLPASPYHINRRCFGTKSPLRSKWLMFQLRAGDASSTTPKQCQRRLTGLSDRCLSGHMLLESFANLRHTAIPRMGWRVSGHRG